MNELSYDANVLSPDKLETNTLGTNDDISKEINMDAEITPELWSDENKDTREYSMDIIETDNQYCFTYFQKDISIDIDPVKTLTFKTSDDNYFKGCKWSPDGSCLLTCNENSSLSFFNLPMEFWEGKIPSSKTLDVDQYIREGEIIYDYCWYPKADSFDADTCFVASSSRGAPVHFWDAISGNIKASYSYFNQVDELDSVYSLCFNTNGKRLFCGLNKKLCIFDVSRPGRECQIRNTYDKGYGQPGIISCITFHPTNSSIYAAGSYSRAIALYNDAQGKMTCMFQGQQGGVTHLKFSPDGYRLYSGGRMDPEILCWDLRNPGEILFIVNRKVETNQRIYFDLSSSGQFLFSGNFDNTVSIWDTFAEPVESENEHILPCAKLFEAHDDTVNGVSIHPSLPLIATTSGRRHYKHRLNAYDLSDDSESEQDTIDNSITLWWMSNT